ncbi:MAG TPA: hypothetical protein VNZ22_16400, partial [Bacillota bacterium]|nr:hypothetical protein [Bacillota bacterium]
YKNGAAIPGATRASVTLNEVPLSDNGAQIVCAIRALGYANDALQPIWSNSQPATLSVVSTPPTFVASAIYTDYNLTNVGGGSLPALCVDLGFSKRMDATVLSNAVYSLTGGLTVTNVAVSGNGRTVKLFVSGNPTGSVTVSVSGLKDASGLSLPAISGAAVRPLGLVSADVGWPGADPIFPSKLWVENTNAFTVEAEGSDIWGTADGFNFLYEQKTGDFDVVVRQKKITHSSQWAKGGLMVRESLNADSRNWNIVNTPVAADGIMAPDNSGYGSSGIECNWRTNTAGESTGWDNIPRDTPAAYPNAWVRLKRSGQVLTAYYSTNGLSWKLAATQDVSTTAGGALPSTVYLGIATTAHNNDTFEPYKFWNVSEYADYNSSYVAPLPAATLKVTLVGANASISWTPAGGRLQSSASLSGGWTDVTGATNPMTVPTTGQPKFYRVVNP